MTRPTRWHTMAAVCVAVALSQAPHAAASFPRAPTGHGAQAGTVVHADAVLIRRAEASARAWNPKTDTYDSGYIDPAGWRLHLNGCQSTIGGVPVKDTGLPGPEWVVEPLDGQHTGPLREPARKGVCDAVVTLPALGRWRVTATLDDSRGKPASAAIERTFRDLLVVAIGDSFASGEGNKAVTESWTDTQCHRSDKAWPALLANSLQDTSTTVTFLSVACSGAQFRHLIRSSYSGPEPRPGDRRLKPQLLALREMLGSPVSARTRPVDVLLGSVGINELGVAEVLGRCSIKHPFTPCKQDLERKLAGLSHQYDDLELALSARLRVAHTYLAGYPARLFGDSDGGHTTCNKEFGFLTEAGARWITRQVRRLNDRLSRAGDRHGWTVVPTEARFATHGYCADDRWFVQYEESLDNQRNENGTAHPNNRGHRETMNLVRAQVRTDLAAPPPVRFALRLSRLRVTPRPPAKWDGVLEVLADSQILSACGHPLERLVKLKANRWDDLSIEPCARFIVETAGRTIRLGAATTVRVEPRTQPPQPERPRDKPERPDQGGRQPTQFFRIGISRLIRRNDEWVTRPRPVPGILRPAHRMVVNRPWGSMELEYLIEPSALLEPPHATLATHAPAPRGGKP
jgi:hypothetical protein